MSEFTFTEAPPGELKTQPGEVPALLQTGEWGGGAGPSPQRAGVAPTLARGHVDMHTLSTAQAAPCLRQASICRLLLLGTPPRDGQKQFRYLSVTWTPGRGAGPPPLRPLCQL